MKKADSVWSDYSVASSGCRCHGTYIKVQYIAIALPSSVAWFPLAICSPGAQCLELIPDLTVGPLGVLALMQAQ